jgi:tubulin-folding cofactor B
MSGFKTDKQIIRDYITAMDHLQYTQLPEDVVAITMTHSNLPTKHVDLRFNLHQTIAEVKERFRVHIGTPPEYQQLLLKEQGHTICEMADNSRMLGFYSVQSGMEVHIIDNDPYSLSRNGGLTDVSLVEKFKLSDEAYEKRKGTMRDFIRNKRKEDPNFKLSANSRPGAAGAAAAEAGPPPDASTVEGISVGQRCEVMPGARRGTVRFVGEIEEIPAGGYWVGVEFDEPLGHNDGTVKGRVVFTCAPGFGAFVRGKNLEVGDFPVRDIFDELDDEDGEDKNNTKAACAEHNASCACENDEEDEI